MVLVFLSCWGFITTWALPSLPHDVVSQGLLPGPPALPFIGLGSTLELWGKSPRPPQSCIFRAFKTSAMWTNGTTFCRQLQVKPSFLGLLDHPGPWENISLSGGLGLGNTCSCLLSSDSIFKQIYMFKGWNL